MYDQIESFESCVYRLQMLIEVLDGQLSAATQQNIRDDLVAIRTFLLRRENKNV